MKWLTLEAYKDEPVVLDGSLAFGPISGNGSRAARTQYCVPFVGEGGRGPGMVWRDETLVKQVLKENPLAATQWGAPPIPVMPGDAPADEGWFYDKDQKKLFVNFGGHVPGKDVAAARTRLREGVNAGGQSCVRIRKLEVREFTDSGINVGGRHDSSSKTALFTTAASQSGPIRLPAA